MKAEHAEGTRIYAELRGADRAAEMQDIAQGIGAEAVIADLSLEFVFGKVWGRGGLDRKQRSLVTIAVLIALRQTAELQNHLRVGLTNGLTQTEIEEAIVQTAPYAGFPAAWSAAKAFSALEKLADDQR
ncbi:MULTISPECIES: carboxymuconolactone decarboxylase family protein [unclassified Pseudomonas]|uniref:carboxymuconolactone decarboxylase family protein n=1 Tax=unclassified Pseudomonas TaxID=196821 RepID=UPI001CC11AE7|nr:MULTISPECIES: carboxymuconolactone decarboxylase family protein [unclassified Pseudomonas]